MNAVPLAPPSRRAGVLGGRLLDVGVSADLGQCSKVTIMSMSWAHVPLGSAARVAQPPITIASGGRGLELGEDLTRAKLKRQGFGHLCSPPSRDRVPR